MMDLQKEVGIKLREIDVYLTQNLQKLLIKIDIPLNHQL